MASAGFYDDREGSKQVVDRHQALMWEVGDLMAQWEALQEHAQEAQGSVTSCGRRHSEIVSLALPSVRKALYTYSSVIASRADSRSDHPQNCRLVSGCQVRQRARALPFPDWLEVCSVEPRVMTKSRPRVAPPASSGRSGTSSVRETAARPRRTRRARATRFSDTSCRECATACWQSRATAVWR